MAPRADALTNRTTTYSALSAASDPSELGSEPDSWLLLRYLRAHERSGRCAREQRLAATHRTGSGARPAEEQQNRVVADALTDRTKNVQVCEPIQRPEPAWQRARKLVRSKGAARTQTIGVVRA